MKNKKIFGLLIIPLVILPIVSALTNQPVVVPKGMVTITFDDGWDTTYAYAYPQMRAYGYKGVIGVITNDVGQKFWPPYGYCSWSQIQTMVNSGWDAISHSVTHPDFDTLSASQIDYQLAASQSMLNGNLTGNKGSRFWSQPYDTQTVNLTAKVGQYYDMACFSEKTGENYPNPPMQYDVQRYSINNETTIAEIQNEIDYAQAYQVWLVLIFHIIAPPAIGTPYDTYVANSTFAQTLSYIHQQNVPVVTFSDVYDNYVNPTVTPTPSPTATTTPPPTIKPTVTPTPTPQPTNQTVGNLTAQQWADYYQWSTNGSALQTYKGITGIQP
jgi:peptidoglycan/xylan/chitin deacetylase (PgdA/CDA1 family)